MTAAPTGADPYYMAPEQHDREEFGALGPHFDLWAFGCVTIEMASGVPPWVGMRPNEIILSSKCV